MDPNFPDVVLRPGGGRRCRVVYSYTPQNDDELALQEKDEIEFISEVEEGWWRGRLHNKVGVFPSNFVVELPPPAAEEASLSEGDVSAPLSSPEEPVPVLPPKPVREQCRVLYSYEAAIEDELTLAKDDIVTIITKDVEDKGWWKGELRGKIGLFPDNFVQVITPVDESTQALKKPDRPVKNVPAETKIDTKIPLPALATQKTELETANNTHNAHSETAAKRKSADLGLIKPDTVASHRKSLEEKVSKTPLRPPLSGKPKPAATAKPTSVKRLSAELNDLVDGAMPSKLSSKPKSIDSAEAVEDLDLDSVGRSDMLSHITASRPRAPGRRPPSYSTSNPPSNNNHNDGSSPLTNGTSDGVKLEKTAKEKQKQHLPFMDELRVNLKSNKPLDGGPNLEKKTSSFGLWGSKINSQASSETTSSSMSVSSVTSHDVTHVKSTTTSDVTKSSAIASSGASSSFRAFESANSKSSESRAFESSSSRTSDAVSPKSAESVSSKVSELSSVFDDRSKHVGAGHAHDDSRKEVADLRLKVEKLERTVAELATQLREEAEKRRQIEKELSKLTDLVTQV